MPHQPNFEPSIDECLTIKISAINSWGHLRLNWDMYNASYIWSRKGEKVASIGYSIKNISDSQKQIILEYKNKEEPVKYTIEIVGTPTNLGAGKRWYFICPSTSKRCMNLISPSGYPYFLHRSAFPQLMYQSQKKSKEYRKYEAAFDWLFEEERLRKQLGQKYRKRYYRGRPTPLVKKIEKIRQSLPEKEKLICELERESKYQ